MSPREPSVSPGQKTGMECSSGERQSGIDITRLLDHFDSDSHFEGPVVNGLGVVDFPSQPPDDFTGSPADTHLKNNNCGHT